MSQANDEALAAVAQLTALLDRAEPAVTGITDDVAYIKEQLQAALDAAANTPLPADTQVALANALARAGAMTANLETLDSLTQRPVPVPQPDPNAPTV